MARAANKARTFNYRSVKIKLILASLLLNVVILASFLTSSPKCNLDSDRAT